MRRSARKTSFSMTLLLGCIALTPATLLSGCNNGASLPPSIGSTTQNGNTPFARQTHKGHERSIPTVTVTVNTSQTGPAMSADDLGAGMGVWYNFTLPGIAQAFQGANLALTRFPGGSQTDIYHWETGQDGPSGTPCAGNAAASSTFDNLMQDIAIPANLAVAVTLDYGSNSTCTGGADPSEGAALIAHAQQQGYNVAFATIGNEQYVPGSIDCRQPECKSSRDPVQYSTNEPAFYSAAKQANPNVPVCIDANLQNLKSRWNETVFADAQYDCAEIHYYPQRVSTSDTYLLYDAIPQFTSDVNTVKSELATAGHPNTPLFLGEIASALGPYGKQSQSIVGALFAGMAIGEAEQDGIAGMTWHLAYGSCDARNMGGDFARSVYGKQHYGGAMIFSDGSGGGCTATSPPNTPLATADAFQAASYFVHAGETMLGTSVAGSTDVRAYAGTYQGGYACMLFNLNETTAQVVGVQISGKSSGTGGVQVTYDKSLYNNSAQNIWSAPSVSTLGSWNNYITVRLKPWSMVVIQTQ
jgi:hypothetical protein